MEAKDENVLEALVATSSDQDSTPLLCTVPVAFIIRSTTSAGL